MPAKVTFFHANPQQRFDKLLDSAIAGGSSLDVAVAFMTKAGVDRFVRSVRQLDSRECRLCVSVQFPTNLDALLNLSRLLGPRLHIHLGSNTPQERAGKSNLSPLMHSKVVWVGQSNGTVSIFIGSHNWTAKALLGANIEAGTFLVCDPSEQFALDVKTHLDACVGASEVFDPSALDFYKSIQTALYPEGPPSAAREVIEEFEPAVGIVIHAEDVRTDQSVEEMLLYLPLPEGLPLKWFEPVNKAVYLYLYPHGTLIGRRTPMADPVLYQGHVRVVGGDRVNPITGRKVNAQIPDLTTPRLETVGGNIPPATSKVHSQVLATLQHRDTGTLPVYTSNTARPAVQHEVHYEPVVDLPTVGPGEDSLPAGTGEYFAPGSLRGRQFVYQTPIPRLSATLQVPGVSLYRTSPQQTVEGLLGDRRELTQDDGDKTSTRRTVRAVVIEPTETRFSYVYPVKFVLAR